MAYRRKWNQGHTLARLAVAAGSAYALRYSGPVFWASGEFGFVTAGATLALAVTGTLLVSEGFWLLGETFGWLDRKIPRGNKGTGGWVRSKRELAHDLISFPHPGPYWGKLGRDAIFADFTMACVLGPSGSKKDVGHNGVNTLSIRESKTINSLKGASACIYKKALEDRGEEVHVLNFGAIFEDILGPSARYNPSAALADNFYRPGGIQDVANDLQEFAVLIHPDPKSGGEGGNNNRFWDDGSRLFIRFALCANLLVKGYEACLNDSLVLLQDREQLLWTAQWIADRLIDEGGNPVPFALQESPWIDCQDPQDVERFAEYLRGMAANVADLLTSEDQRVVESFLTGSIQSMEPFNGTSRAHKITQDSTFRFSDQKEPGRTVSVFLVADASRLEANKKVIELIMFCMMNEWKRHPNKSKPVYYQANEGSNLLIKDLRSLLTWARAFSIKICVYIQSLSAFRAAYSKETLDTLFSEQDAFLVLPGQSEPETLKLLEEYLGQQSFMEYDYSGQGKGPLSVSGFSMRESGRPVMTAEQIRRSGKAILWLKKNRPALVDLPSIAAVAPFRHMQAINPFYGKPYRLPVRLRLWRYMWPGKLALLVLNALRALRFWRRS
ncbi:MAG: TraM recognition domain-containing protein [Alphaproteobacteria bacterium]|nr:TraM recognition domain-containing protein [Alphaproteobacteria bacterium]